MPERSPSIFAISFVHRGAPNPNRLPMTSSSFSYGVGVHGAQISGKHRYMFPVTSLCFVGLILSVLLFGNIKADFVSRFASSVCFVLLSMAVLLPLSIRSASAASGTRFTVEPLVFLHAIYFVVAPLVSLLFADYAPSNEDSSLNLWPTSLLVLAIGFYMLHRGIRLSHRRSRTDRQGTASPNAVVPVAFFVSLAALSLLRLVLLRKGLGITHGPSMLEYDRDLGTWAVVTGAFEYVPLSLCIARLFRAADSSSSSSDSSRELRRWRFLLLFVVASDCLYYLLIGFRLRLLWEFLVLLWAWWSRPGCIPRKFVIWGLVAMSVAIPAAYAQRLLLLELNLNAGENQVSFLRNMLPAAVGLSSQTVWSSAIEGLSGDAAYRVDYLNFFARVAYQHFEKHRGLLLGSTWGHALPLIIPHWLWPSKPPAEASDEVCEIIDEHFGLPPTDDNKTTETEVFANFGVLGLWIWMFIYGVLLGKFALGLAAKSPLRESTVFLILCVIPILFRIDIETPTILAGLRLPLLIWSVLWLADRRQLVPQANKRLAATQ
jgi:hypothetical protein